MFSAEKMTWNERNLCIAVASLSNNYYVNTQYLFRLVNLVGHGQNDKLEKRKLVARQFIKDGHLVAVRIAKSICFEIPI